MWKECTLSSCFVDLFKICDNACSHVSDYKKVGPISILKFRIGSYIVKD